jgi:hypothetical protein
MSQNLASLPGGTTAPAAIIRAHKELPPIAFRINIPVTAMCVSRSNPYRMDPWRLFPPAGLPVITASFIAVVSAYPNMIPAWTGSAVFMDADRRTKFYDDLGMCRTKAQCGPDECVKKNFHFVHPITYRQVDGQCPDPSLFPDHCQLPIIRAQG